MCPYDEEEARRLWSKACNYHRGADLCHECSNPAACERTLRGAELAEEVGAVECRSIGIGNIDYWESWQRRNY
jgi:hypothetical protein